MTYFEHSPLTILLDTGAENNIIGTSVVKRLNIKVLPTPSKASQVDKSLLKSVGRIVIPIYNGEETWTFDALVCDNVGDVIIGGNPLLDQGINPVTYRNEIDIVTAQGSIRKLPWRPPTSHHNFGPRIGILRCEESVTLYPGEFLEIQAPPPFQSLGTAEVLVRPRATSNIFSVCMTTTKYDMAIFPSPEYTWMIQGRVRIPNTSSLPLNIPKHRQIADISLVCSSAILSPLVKPMNVLPTNTLPSSSVNLSQWHHSNQSKQLPDPTLYPRPKPVPPVCQVDKVLLDPDNILEEEHRQLFMKVHEKYSQVFSSKPGLYNGALGNLDAHLILNNNNIEPPSFPCRKIIQSDKLNQLKQNLMDEMEADGLLVRPEDHGIHLTHVHESYLVPKLDDGVPTGEYRLVTNMQSLSPYIKPTRIPLPTIEESFRKLGKWKYIVLMDLRSWHWQIPMDKKSMRFLGTSTPFGGDRVYAVQPQGYLNATENSDRVIQIVLEPVMRQGKCLRVADNLITGGNTPQEAVANYELILKLCNHCGLTFKASKTVICPKQVNILGKVWNQGKLSPSVHLMSTIANISFPATVKQMRSFVGSVKQMKDNIKNYHLLLHPLERVVAGRKSAEKITWTEALRDAFKKVKNVVTDPDILVLPRPTEKLVIYPDWSDEHQAGAAPLYVRRNDKLLKVRNFGQRLRAMKRWAPCEGEAWIIRIGVENHSPWIEESSCITEVATDSYPCVLAFRRLRRGQFSKSVRVAYFLSTLGSYKVDLIHRPGLNHPGDFDSRNCASCELGKKCQVCCFSFDLAGPTAHELVHPGHVPLPDSVVMNISINDVLTGPAVIPFTQRPGWLDIQAENNTLKKLRMHMKGGTIPARNIKGEKELKSLYTLFQHQKLTIAKDNMIVKIEVDKMGDKKELIVVPAKIMKGLILALHYRFAHPHPSSKELLTLCNRYWFAIGTAKLIEEIKENCQLCKSIAPVPREFFEQNTSKSGKLGTSWACDVIRGDTQYIFVAREKLSSFTVSKIIPNERHETLREAIIVTTSELIPEEGLTMQVDNATGLVKLVGDSQLERYKIKVDAGRKHNKDSNPVAEKAVKEFREQKLKFKPEGGPISDVERATITASMNRMIRNRKLSSKEIVTNRDQNTHKPLNINDDKLADDQFDLRKENHPLSEKSKVKKGKPATRTEVWPGALVFLKKDKSKLRARETYIVIKVENDEFCTIKKLKNKLMAESYKVKLTEICLLPNQIVPDEDAEPTEEVPDAEELKREDESATIPTSEEVEFKEIRIKPNRYNIRDKPRVNYRQLNEGNFAGMTRAKPIQTKLLYAWDTPENSEDDDDIQVDQKLPFQIWSEKQPAFFPKNSIFIHYFKDKYPEMDPKSIVTLASSLLSTVRAPAPPLPSRTSSESSEFDTISVPDDARSMEWDNYNSSPSFEFPRHSPGAPSPPLSNVPTSSPNITPDLIHKNKLDATEDEKESHDEDPDVFEPLQISPPTPNNSPIRITPQRTLTQDSDLELVIQKGDEAKTKRNLPHPATSESNLIQCSVESPSHVCSFPPAETNPLQDEEIPHHTSPPIPPEPPPPRLPPQPLPKSRRHGATSVDYKRLNEYGKQGPDAWKEPE